MAYGVAELVLGAGAPGLQGQGLLIRFHEVAEADAAAGQSLGLVQGGPQDLLQGGRSGQLGDASTGGQDRFGQMVPGDVLKGDQGAAVPGGLG